jgi:hypothetical protein
MYHGLFFFRCTFEVELDSRKLKSASSVIVVRERGAGLSKLEPGVFVPILVLVTLVLAFNTVPVNAEPQLFDVLTTLHFTHVANSTVETFPPGTYDVSLLAEFAGYYAENNLSWYLVGTTDYNVIFLGSDGNSGYVSPPVNRTFTANAAFGLSLATPENHRYFTENSKNPDYLPLHLNHSLVVSNLDNMNMYLLGFENLYGGGDKDFQDMVISLQFVAPLSPPVGGEWVPINKPALLLSWGSLVSLTMVIAASFVCVRRIKKRQN